MHHKVIISFPCIFPNIFLDFPANSLALSLFNAHARFVMNKVKWKSQ
uniref:Uncharacterized protein n=1 Tax=Rhizophora mucronata TaxID=61149 RepID=A0A2P2KQG0_RHIMU